jgi:hypothetical protein
VFFFISIEWNVKYFHLKLAFYFLFKSTGPREALFFIYLILVHHCVVIPHGIFWSGLVFSEFFSYKKRQAKCRQWPAYWKFANAFYLSLNTKIYLKINGQNNTTADAGWQQL